MLDPHRSLSVDFSTATPRQLDFAADLYRASTPGWCSTTIGRGAPAGPRRLDVGGEHPDA
jgi:hypothetical protein